MDHRQHIIPHSHHIQPVDRYTMYGYVPKLYWFTGLSGSGKSTLASAFEVHLFNAGYHTYILDGDNIRTGLNQDLDFSDLSRKENIRRIAEVSKLMLEAGTMVLTAFISPFAEDREQAKSIVGADRFVEVFVDTPLEICEQRDVKGLYAKARAGQIKHFTGIDSPFERPAAPDVHIETADKDVATSLQELIDKTKTYLGKA